MAFTPKVKRQIIADNLGMQGRDIATALEARLSHLSDLARAICDDLEAPTPATLATLLEREPLLLEEPALHREVLQEHKGHLADAMKALTLYDRVHLCRFLAERFEEEKSVALQDFLSQDTPPTRIAYMRNNFTDEAFDMFTMEMQEPTALHTEDYEASCLAVAVGDAGACILPYLDSYGQKVRVTQSYLTAHSLKVRGVYTVYNGEDEGFTYALCTKGLSTPKGAYTLLLHLPDITSYEVEELLGGMRLCGLETETSTYLQGQLTLTLTGNAPLLPLFVFLTLYYPTHIVEGLYEESLIEEI